MGVAGKNALERRLDMLLRDRKRIEERRKKGNEVGDHAHKTVFKARIKH